MSIKHPMTAYEVYKSPEFQAFCKRFGIAWDLATLDLVITFKRDSLLEVSQVYVLRPEKDVVDTTNAHNREYETSVPKPEFKDAGP